MRIGFWLAGAGRAPGGVRRYAASLAETLGKVPRHPWEEWGILDAPRPGRLPLAKHWAAWRASRLPVDLLHVPNTYAPWTRTRCRKIVTVHDLTPLSHPWAHQRRNVLHHRLFLRRIVAASDAVIVPSRSTADALRDAFGAADGKVAAIPDGVSPAFRAPSRRDAGRKGSHLLFVGANEPRKNLAGVLAAHRILRARGVALPLVVAGPAGWGGRKRPRPDARAEGVDWRGLVPEEDLVRLYREAALLLYPSFHEGFGLPLLEAMAAGTPAVTSARGALPETAGDAALYADPGDPGEIADCAGRLLSDDGLWARLSERGMERAAGYTWERTAEETWKLYRNVLNRTA